MFNNDVNLKDLKTNEKPPDDVSTQLIELQPCKHIMCDDCFHIFPEKLCTDKCPACTQTIVTYQVLVPMKLEADQGVKEIDRDAVVQIYYQAGEVADY